MSQDTADKFIKALQALEQNKEVEPLAALYTEEAVAGNVVAPDQFQGKDGARAFWNEYRGTFGAIQSNFRNIIATEDRAALEWTSTGTSFNGAPVQYSGVTILETRQGQITRSLAYFSPQALGEQIGPAP